MAEGPVTIHQNVPDEARTAMLLQTNSSSLSNPNSKEDWDDQFNVLNSRLRKARLTPDMVRVLNQYYTEYNLHNAMIIKMAKIKRLWKQKFLALPEESQRKELESEPDYLDRLDRMDEFDIVKKTYADESAEILNISVSAVDEGAPRKTALYQDMLIQQSKTFSEEKLTQREEKKGLF